MPLIGATSVTGSNQHLDPLNIYQGYESLSFLQNEFLSDLVPFRDYFFCEKNVHTSIIINCLVQCTYYSVLQITSAAIEVGYGSG